MDAHQYNLAAENMLLKRQWQQPSIRMLHLYYTFLMYLRLLVYTLFILCIFVNRKCDMFFLTMAIHTGCTSDLGVTTAHQSEPFATNQMLPGTVYCASKICHILLLHTLTLNVIQISDTPALRMPSDTDHHLQRLGDSASNILRPNRVITESPRPPAEGAPYAMVFVYLAFYIQDAFSRARVDL